MHKANHAPSTHGHAPKDYPVDYTFDVTDNRLDSIDIRPLDVAFCASIKTVDALDLHGKLVHVRRTRHFGSATFTTDDVWRATLQPDGKLKLTSQSSIRDYSAEALVYPAESEHDTIEIIGRVTSASRYADNLEVKTLSQQLWVEPKIEAPTSAFCHYLDVRDFYRARIAEAARLPEPEIGPIEVDRLSAMLFEAALPIIHRIPETPGDAVETAIVVRDRFFDMGSDKPHSQMDATVAAQLIAAVLTVADPIRAGSNAVRIITEG